MQSSMLQQISSVRGPDIPQTSNLERTTGKVPGGKSEPMPRTPQQVLAESKQRFPRVDESVLKGMAGVPGLKGEPLDHAVRLLRARPLGMTPVFIGSGGDARLVLMPTKGVPGRDPGAAIQKYVTEGQELYAKIMNNEKVPRGKEQIAKLMWFLQALGSDKASLSAGQNPPSPALFKEGAFTVEDPDRRLEAYLNGANSYKRASSHLKEFQGKPGCEPRGVDVRGVPTPNSRKTVMFARMPGREGVKGDATANHMGDKNFLFIKMEPHGCRGLSCKGTGRAGGAAGAGKSILRFFANIRDFFGHAGGFLKSVSQRSGLASIHGLNNRERIPGDVAELYKNILEITESAGSKPLQALQRNDPLSSTGGIRVMIRNLEAAIHDIAHAPDNAKLLEPRKDLGGQSVMGKMKNALDLLRGRGDHSEHRIGNEVILTREELDVGEVRAPVAPRGNDIVSGTGVLDARTREVMLAALTYSLADTASHEEKAQQFRRDAPRTTMHIGPWSRETAIENNAEEAEKAMLSLTGNDAKKALALMGLANQSLVPDFAEAMRATALKSSLLHVGPQGGAFHISRLPDKEDKTQVYRVGWTVDAPPQAPDGVLPSVMNKAMDMTVDMAQSSLKAELWLDVAFRPDGTVEPAFHGEPRFSYKLVPGKKDGGTVDGTNNTSPVPPGNPTDTGKTTPPPTTPGVTTTDKATPPPTTPGVTITEMTGGTLPGTAVTFNADIGTGMSQKQNTCFIVSALRGLVEAGDRGRAYLSSRVSREENGTYHVRLTHEGRDFDVAVTENALAGYGNPQGRDQSINALECALVRFMESKNGFGEYKMGAMGDAVDVCNLLGLEQYLESIGVDSNEEFTKFLNNNQTSNTIMLLRSPGGHQVGNVAGEHFVTVTGQVQNGQVIIKDSLHPGQDGSLPLADLRGQLGNYQSGWQLVAFTIPQ